jgi:hypothetical protein
MGNFGLNVIAIIVFVLSYLVRSETMDEIEAEVNKLGIANVFIPILIAILPEPFDIGLTEV